MLSLPRLDRRHRGTALCVLVVVLLVISSMQQLKLNRIETLARQHNYSVLLGPAQRVDVDVFIADRAKSVACDKFEDVQTLPILDECVLRYIREQLLEPPSKLNYSRYALTTPYSSTRALKPLFGNKTRGFFVECGANDGVYNSNTLGLERNQSWTGLLVEAQTALRKSLLSKHRKAWFANVCLSPYNNISKISLIERDKKKYKWHDTIAKLDMEDDPSPRKYKDWAWRDKESVPCFPLASILAAMNVTHVDFFSLDVEGVELKILKTLPYDESLTIDVIQVEVKHIPEGKEALKSFLESKGYELFGKYSIDLIFKRKEM